MQNISHENDLIFKRMNLQVTAFSYKWFDTKTCFATEAKVHYSSMSWLKEPLILVLTGSVPNKPVLITFAPIEKPVFDHR